METQDTGQRPSVVSSYGIVEMRMPTEDAADYMYAADAEPHVLRICSPEHLAHVWWIGSLALERPVSVDQSADCEPCPSSSWD